VYRYTMAPRNAYASFAVFGALWGAWGASLPAIRDQAGLSAGELGTALLFVGAGALPAMLLAGRGVDRWGTRATALLLVLLGGVGVATVAAAQGMLGLAVALAMLGASSGAADVAINTGAGAAQRAHGGAVIARAHAAFSAAVVVASLLTGALRGADLPVVTPFLAVAAAAIAVAVTVIRAGDGSVAPGDRARRGGLMSLRAARVPLAPLLAIGALGALAFAVENAHQSWSALYLRDELGAGAAIAAAGPAIFAGAVAITRFAAGALGARRPALVIVAGSALAAAGTGLVAVASTLGVALAGLGFAAAGTAVLFPTLLVVLTARVPDHVRGTATSAVTTVAYLGFLAGPPYVGAWADGVGLPGAMLAVAGLALALAALAAATLRMGVPSPAPVSASGPNDLRARHTAHRDVGGERPQDGGVHGGLQPP
jgi:predicted MFS family arabinose efflux permease